MTEFKEAISTKLKQNIYKSGINLPELHEKLFISSSENQHGRDEVLAIFKSTLAEAKNTIKSRFQSGLLSGLEAAKLIAKIHDDIIVTLFDYTMKEIAETPNPGNALRISLCAVGGYGRGEMAPESDVDLLFLTVNHKGQSSANVVNRIYALYALGSWHQGRIFNSNLQ